MRRTIAILAAVLLVASALGGFVYAQTNGHQPMTGQKLVGGGTHGTTDTPGAHLFFTTHFGINNPDCVGEITIKGLSILGPGGTVIYKGPLLRQRVEGIEVVESIPVYKLPPHCGANIPLQFYFPDPDDPEHEWMNRDEANALPSAHYEVELFWEGVENSLPLLGTVQIMKQKTIDTGETMESGYMVNMMNLEQILMPEEEVTTLRLQSWLPSSNPWVTPIVNFIQAVEERSGGSVRVEFFGPDAIVPNSQLAEAVKHGEIDMALIPSSVLSNYSRVIDAIGLPFLYNNDDGFTAALQKGIGDLLSAEMETDNIRVISWSNSGLYHLLSDVGILDQPVDMSGLEIRAVLGIQSEAMNLWGATPKSIPANEVYDAFLNDDIDGIAWPVTACESFKVYKVAPYLCMDYAFASAFALCINSDVWAGLDSDIQKIISKAAEDYVDEMLEKAKLEEAAALGRMLDDPDVDVVVYTLGAEERSDWREASQPLWEDWANEVGEVGDEIIKIALKHNPLP